MTGDLIRLPTCALILGLMPREIITPPDWERRSTSRRAAIPALRAGLVQPSFWTEQQIRNGFAIANRIWAQANIEFPLVRIERRWETVPTDQFDMHMELGNRYARLRGCAVVAGFVHGLSPSHGGVAGGRFAVISDTRAAGASEEWRGTIIAHELGHVLSRRDRGGSPDGNLMFRTATFSRRPAQDLEPMQIEMSRTRARQILDWVRRLNGE